jgi:hypothetical protein
MILHFVFYGRKAWSVVLMGEHRLRSFEKNVLVVVVVVAVVGME